MNRLKFILGFLIFLLPTSLRAQALEDGLYATIYAEDYQLLLKLFDKRAPMTVANFVGLAEGSISNDAFDEGRPFFDGSIFNRVVPGHVIQGGVPNSSKASNTGYTIPNEIHPELNHKESGALGMANAGPDTGSSVFYITLGDRSYLDGDYAVFGELVGDPPHDLRVNTRIDSIRIVRVGSEAEAYQVDDELLASLIEEVQQNNARAKEEKVNFENEFLETNYPELEASKYGWRFQVLKKGKGKKVEKLESVNLRFIGNTPQGMEFGSTNVCSSYWIPDGGPASCEYYPNITKIITGLDEAILEMRLGAKWVVVLDPEQAYGISGFYPPLDWGDKRFHISPNTTIVYEVEILP